MSAKAYDKITAAFAGFVIQNIPHDLDGVTMQGWMDNPVAMKKFLEGLKPPSKPNQILNFKQDFAVVAPKKALDLKNFFENRSGLYVWDGFANHAKELLVKVEPTAGLALKSFDLGQNAYDGETKAGLPKKHEVDLWVIAEMIVAQEGGKEGPLLANGYWNIFYVSGFVVLVRWGAGNGGWGVDGYDLDDAYRDAGSRVFSRN